jgi:hypothetical protein
VVVDRSAPVDERTIAIDRSDADERTIAIDRSETDERTIAIDRSETDESTLVVDRQPKPRASVMRTLPRRGAKRQITLAPGAGANKTATPAVGPGAISEYTARPIAPPPAQAPAVQLGPEASRANAPSMPSVARQSRRRGTIAVGAAAAAVLISVVGLVLIVNALLAG